MYELKVIRERLICSRMEGKLAQRSELVITCKALMMEAARTSETLVNFYQTTRCYNPEDSNLQESVICLLIEEESGCRITDMMNFET
jgi:hypothetical protein